jgi:hypothetical protein
MCYYKGMNERAKNSEVYQVGDVVRFIGKNWGEPHPEVGVVVSLDCGPFKDPDDGSPIQVKFGDSVKFIQTVHPFPQLEFVSANLREGEIQ